jgi:hypothetical protein
MPVPLSVTEKLKATCLSYSPYCKVKCHLYVRTMFLIFQSKYARVGKQHMGRKPFMETGTHVVKEDTG